MKMNPETDLDDELRSEYMAADLNNRIRGKYAGRMEPMPPMVVLEPDVAEVFTDAAAVNEALRFLIKSTRENPLVAA